MSENILTISDLHTSFFTPVGEVKAVFKLEKYA